MSKRLLRHVDAPLEHGLDVVPQGLPVAITLPHVGALIDRDDETDVGLEDLFEGVGRGLHVKRDSSVAVFVALASPLQRRPTTWQVAADMSVRLSSGRV